MIRRLFAAAAALALLGTFAPAAFAIPPFRAPVPQRRTLANGLEVVVFPRPGLGVVQVELALPAGVGAEKADAPGSAALVSQMLRWGTTSRASEQFAQDLDRLGGSLAASAQQELATVAAAFLPEDLESGLELMSDAVVNPVFDETQYDRVRTLEARDLLRLHRDPAGTSEEQLWGWALPGLPAARPPLGTITSLLDLPRETLGEFHRDHYRPDHAVLAIAGDIPADKAFAYAGEWFTRWSGTSAPLPAAPPIPPAKTVRILIVDRPELPAAWVRLAWRVPGRGAADDLARTVGARLLDQSLEKKLDRKLPGGSPVELNLGVVQSAGLLTFGFAVPVDSIGSAIARVRRAVRDGVAAPVSEADLGELAKQFRNAYPTQFETPGALLNQWVAARMNGLDPDATIAEYPARLSALTPGAVSAALSRDLDLEHPVLVVVGPADRLRPALARMGEVQVMQLDQPASVANTAAPDTLPPPSPEDEQRGRELAAKLAAAHGGLEKLRGVRTTLSESRLTMSLQGRDLQGEMRQLRKEPYKMVFLTSFETIESRQVLNGKAAWSATSDGQLQDADSLAVSALRSGFSSDVPHLLLAANDPASRVVSRGVAKFGDRDARVLDVTSANGERRRLYVDPAKSQLIGMDQNEASGPGTRLTTRRIYRDLRSVNGILLPYDEERQLDGTTVMRLFTTRAEVNGDISDDEFVRPSGQPKPAR